MGHSISSLALVIFLYCVKCQWSHFVVADLVLDFGNQTSSNPGWSPHDGVPSTNFHSFTVSDPATRKRVQKSFISSNSLSGPSGKRRRRQVFHTKNFNAVERSYTWSHSFNMEWENPMRYSKDSTYTWQENADRLKKSLEVDNLFQFSKPTGLKISIPDSNINMRILDFRYKLNQEFRDDSQFAAQWLKSSNGGSRWTYEIPNLQLNQGDKVYYWMHVKFAVDGLNVIVKGVLDITKGNPHSGDAIQFRPTRVPVVSPPGQSSYLTPGLGGGQGSGTTGAFIWNQQFNIDPPDYGGFTRDTYESWSQNAELLKNSLQRDTDFKFPNPSGLMILIPDNNIRIVDFRVKLNEEFRDNDVGHFTPASEKKQGRWTYYIPQLRVKQGDQIYYWMKVKMGNERFEAIVRGVMEISQGNPYMYPMWIRPSPPFPPPQTQTTNVVGTYPPSGSGMDKSTGGNAFSWNHKFTIKTNGRFTQEAANNWLRDLELFKNTLEKNIEFLFLNPIGLSISISGDNQEVKILEFNIKLNQEFKGLESGQYLANFTRTRDGRWNYYYPNLKLTQGDKLYYWMRVTFGKESFDNIVMGLLEVTEGNPHVGGPASSTTWTLTPQSAAAGPGNYYSYQNFPTAPPAASFRPGSYYPSQNFPAAPPSTGSYYPSQNSSVAPPSTGNYYPSQNFPAAPPSTGNYNPSQNSTAAPPSTGNYYPSQNSPAAPPSTGNYYPSQNSPAAPLSTGNYYPSQNSPAAPPSTGNYYPSQNSPSAPPITGNYPYQNSLAASPSTGNYYPSQNPPSASPGIDSNKQSPYYPTPSLGSPPTQPCNVSQSSWSGDTTPPCRGQVLLEHHFNTMDGWDHQVTIGGKFPGFAITFKLYLQL